MIFLRNLTRYGASAAVCLCVAVSAAQAHTGLGSHFSLMDGALHPLSGWDHLAAMISVGLWAALAGGTRLWVWPLTFVTTMIAGGVLGHTGLALPAVEPAIAASVVVLGLLVAAGAKAPLVPGALLVAAFALFHGYAHGAEAPETGWLGYAAGFAAMTAVLHLAGIALGLGIERAANQIPVRALGAVVACFGLFLFLN